MHDVTAVLVPQLNVNDDTVRLGGWLVARGAQVREGDAICEVETSKAASELVAEREGLLYPLIEPGDAVDIGGRVALIGPSIEAIEAYLAGEAAEKEAGK